MAFACSGLETKDVLLLAKTQYRKCRIKVAYITMDYRVYIIKNKGLKTKVCSFTASGYNIIHVFARYSGSYK